MKAKPLCSLFCHDQRLWMNCHHAMIVRTTSLQRRMFCSNNLRFNFWSVSRTCDSRGLIVRTTALSWWNRQRYEETNKGKRWGTCVYVCMCSHVCGCVCVHVCACVCEFMSMHMCVCVCVDECAFSECMHTNRVEHQVTTECDATRWPADTRLVLQCIPLLHTRNYLNRQKREKKKKIKWARFYHNSTSVKTVRWNNINWENRHKYKIN